MKDKNLTYVRQALRVNLAGEEGACAIYAGQLAYIKDKELYHLIQHMYAQEQDHKEIFRTIALQRGIRPTLFSDMWNKLGWFLGASTAWLGADAALICTIAVEEVIDAHYETQKQTLHKTEKSLVSTIDTCQGDEQEHHDTAASYLRTLPKKWWHKPLHTSLVSLTQGVIAITKKI